MVTAAAAVSSVHDLKDLQHRNEGEGGNCGHVFWDMNWGESRLSASGFASRRDVVVVATVGHMSACLRPRSACGTAIHVSTDPEFEAADGAHHHVRNMVARRST